MIAKNKKHQDDANFEFVPEFLNLAYSHIQNILNLVNKVPLCHFLI